MTAKIDLRNTDYAGVVFTYNDGVFNKCTAISLKNFWQNAQGNFEREEDKGIYGNPKAIVAAAQKIYSQINPEYYKKHVSTCQKIHLFVLKLFSKESFARKLSQIVRSYLNSQREVNLPLILPGKVDEEQFSYQSSTRELFTAGPSSGSLSPLIDENPWNNPDSFRNRLLNDKLKELGISQAQNPKKVRELQREIDEQFKTRPSFLSYGRQAPGTPDSEGPNPFSFNPAILPQ